MTPYFDLNGLIQTTLSDLKKAKNQGDQFSESRGGLHDFSLAYALTFFTYIMAYVKQITF